MNTLKTTSCTLGEIYPCAEQSVGPFPGAGMITHQNYFPAISRREVMAAIHKCAASLGLKPTSVLVLDALLSCLPCRSAGGNDIPVSSKMLLTVYASNANLCERAKGIDERLLRRHLCKLETAGLIQRRDSANGKRFPIHQKGAVIGAFGIDVSPLFLRAQALNTLKEEIEHQKQELRGVMARIRGLRLQLLSRSVGQLYRQTVEELPKVLRKKSTDLEQAKVILSQLEAYASTEADTSTQSTNTASWEAGADSTHIEAVSAPHREGLRSPDKHTVTIKTPANDGQIDRHIKPNTDTKIKHTSWDDLKEISSFYSEPTDTNGALRIAYEFAGMLRISRELLTKAVKFMEYWDVLGILDRIASKIDLVKSPNSYFSQIVNRVSSA